MTKEQKDYWAGRWRELEDFERLAAAEISAVKLIQAERRSALLAQALNDPTDPKPETTMSNPITNKIAQGEAVIAETNRIHAEQRKRFLAELAAQKRAQAPVTAKPVADGATDRQRQLVEAAIRRGLLRVNAPASLHQVNTVPAVADDEPADIPPLVRRAGVPGIVKSFSGPPR
jgi:hypothetical protein